MGKRNRPEPVNEELDSDIEEPRASKRLHRRSSKHKNDSADKENIDAARSELEKMQRKVAQLEAKLAAEGSREAAKDLDDDGAESEEEQNPPMPSRSGSIQILPSIRVSGPAPDAAKITHKLKRTTEVAPRLKPHVAKYIEPSTNRESTPEESESADDASSANDAFFSSLGPALPSLTTAATKGRVTSNAAVPQSASASGGSAKVAAASQLPPATVTDGIEAKVPTIREGSNHKPKEPKASDYDDTVKALILRACLEYECMISAVNPFPDTAERIIMATKCWDHACKDIGELYAITDPIKLLICERGSRIRNHALGKIRQRIEHIFGFDHRKDKRTIARNKKLSEKLRKDSAFRYKDPDSQTGYMKGRLVYECLQTAWFEKKKSHGVVFGKTYFDPIRIKTIALIFTIADFVLEQWSTGTYNTEASMYETDVRDCFFLFESHLQQWRNLNPEVVDKMLATLYRRACRDAGVTQEQAPKMTLEDAVLKRMREELEGRTGETDSEAEETSSSDEEDEEVQVANGEMEGPDDK